MADDLVNEVQKFDLKPKAQAITGAVGAAADFVNNLPQKVGKGISDAAAWGSDKIDQGIVAAGDWLTGAKKTPTGTTTIQDINKPINQ